MGMVFGTKHLDFCYVTSKENPADEKSRISNIDTEWEIADYTFNSIKREFSNQEIDLFASTL